MLQDTCFWRIRNSVMNEFSNIRFQTFQRGETPLSTRLSRYRTTLLGNMYCITLCQRLFQCKLFELRFSSKACLRKRWADLEKYVDSSAELQVSHCCCLIVSSCIFKINKFFTQLHINNGEFIVADSSFDIQYNLECWIFGITGLTEHFGINKLSSDKIW